MTERETKPKALRLTAQPMPAERVPADLAVVRKDLDAADGMEWWNALSEPVRAFWLNQAGSAAPADAWERYKQAKCIHTGFSLRFCICAAHKVQS